MISLLDSRHCGSSKFLAGAYCSAILVIAGVVPLAATAGDPGFDRAIVSYSADVMIPFGDPIGSNQFWLAEVFQPNQIIPALSVLPRNARPNGYKRLPNGNHLITFSNVVELNGVPGVGWVFPGDIIELSADWQFVAFRLRMDDVGGFSGFFRHVNVNAVTVDPDDPSIILFSIDRSATLPGLSALPSDILRYSGGSTIGFVFDGQEAIGRNINALDLTMVDGQRIYSVVFESGGTINGVPYDSSTILALTVHSSGVGWRWFRMNAPIFTPEFGRTKIEALDFSPVSGFDRVFRDAFLDSGV